jgi:energy-converting hydrogenase Eha subunit G
MPELNSSVDLEARRETGAACMIIGAIFWLVAFIAMFFHPAAWISGSLAIVEYAGGLVIVGSVVFLLGWRARRRANA